MKGSVTGGGFFGLRRRERERESGHGGERSLGGATAERSLGGATALSQGGCGGGRDWSPTTTVLWLWDKTAAQVRSGFPAVAVPRWMRAVECDGGL